MKMRGGSKEHFRDINGTKCRVRTAIRIHRALAGLVDENNRAACPQMTSLTKVDCDPACYQGLLVHDAQPIPSDGPDQMDLAVQTSEAGGLICCGPTR
jgi:hypothetical protein